MIKTKADLRFYLEEDRKRNHVPPEWGIYVLRLIAGEEQAHIFRYIRCLRHVEFYLNNQNKSIFHKLLFYWYRYRQLKMGLRYGIKISPNVCGYGLRIMHLSGGGGVRIGAKKCGNYCGFNAGVIIGTKDGEANRPTIGDHVAFGPGSMAFGRITIGNNVFVAPNAVVTKDVPDNCIVGGIPAKVLKYKEEKE